MAAKTGELEQLTVERMLIASSRTANVNSATITVTDYVGAVRIIQASGNITAGDNDSTYTAVVQHSDADTATLFTNVDVTNYAISAATNQGSVVAVTIPKRALKTYVRVMCNITGANSPAFPYSVTLEGYKQAR